MEIGWTDVFNPTFSNISAISWQPVLVVEEAGVPGENHRPKVKIVKNERDPLLFTGKLLIKFQNILRNITKVIIRHRVKILISVISSPITLGSGGYILVSCAHSNTSCILMYILYFILSLI
jgi:hypothetical protein